MPPILQAFEPQVLVSQHGCDSHALDPLANLMLSVDGQRTAYELLHRWSHEYAEDRWVATGGGGYAIVEVVPRAWTLLMAELSGHPLAPSTVVPEVWRTFAQARGKHFPPTMMTDGRTPLVTDIADGWNPADVIDQLILDVANTIFPLHGIHPGWVESGGAERVTAARVRDRDLSSPCATPVTTLTVSVEDSP